jgi:hypothetical protein
VPERFWVKLDRNRFYREIMGCETDAKRNAFVVEFASNLFFGKGESPYANELLQEAGISYEKQHDAAINAAYARWGNAKRIPKGIPKGTAKRYARTEQNRTEQENTSLPGATAPRQRNELFDAIADNFFSGGLAKADASRIGKLAATLKERGATPEQVSEKKATYARMHPDWELTPEAVVKHWPTLNGAKQNKPFAPQLPWADELP